ncbi:MAG TPA: aldehyde ferredoxin oxidoreductase [Desulfonatronum sp.]|nr:aldehyde ferredoxin oxidoreductase [Desulfonatronum sp.]
MHGWRGTILDVDLGRNTLLRQPLDPTMAENFLGGRGFNDVELFKRIPVGIDPLDPENVLCFAPGPLSGTPLSLTSRIAVGTLSPYSGILGDGNAGGRMAQVMKRAGYDQIIVSGRFAKPVYLLVEDQRASLEACPEFWGTDTWTFTDAMRQRHGKNVSVACIGQAGECLVRFASIIVDKHASAARGSGAVMGSKNLKGLVVKGTGRVSLACPEVFKTLAEEDREFFRTDPFQTTVASRIGSLHGILNWSPGYRNFKTLWGPEDVPPQLRPESFARSEVGRAGCRNCPVQCKNRFVIPSGPRAGEQGAALEYECVYCLGTNCGITDPAAIMEMENLCDRYGMDVIAAGNTLAMLKDLFDQGRLTLKDTGGLDLGWERADEQIELLHCTALRQGFGNLAAEGLIRAAAILGPAAQQVCYHVKGLSRGPSPAGMFALAHATGTRGADHLRGRSWAYGENDADLFPRLKAAGKLPPDMDDNPVAALRVSERACTLADCVGRCKGAVNSWSCAVPLVWRYPLLDGLARLLTAATGLSFTEESLIQAADRVYLLEKTFNALRGVTRVHDRLVLHKDLQGTPAEAEEQAKHAAMLTAYYLESGQDPATGTPTRQRLSDLGLDWAADSLEAALPVPEWSGPPPWPLDSYPAGKTRV